MGTGAGGPPDGPPPLTENRPDFPCSLSLSNLVRLDWQHRQELFPHGPGASKLERLGFKGRAYNVESLEPGATGNKFVYLYPEKRYYVVPIYEEGQAPDAPQRFLLVRSREDKEEPGLHIFVVEPLEPPAPDEPFAHLHVIGNEDDTATAEPMPPTVGIVEAVLTTTETIPDQLAESPATPPQSATPPDRESEPISTGPQANMPDAAESSAAQPPRPEEPDEDLLQCIDKFNSVIGRSSGEAEKDLLSLRDCLLAQLRRKYRWELMRIVLNTTQFDEQQGHRRAGTAYLSQAGDGVVVAVQNNGYTCADKVVRNAQVIVNCVPSRVARLNKLVPLSRKQMYLEIVARQDMIIDEVIHDAAKQVGIIDVIYSLLTILAVASPSRIHDLAGELAGGKATSSRIRENLGRTPPLHLRYLRRTPEMYVALRGVIEPLATLRQILITEAARRNENNYYLQAGRAWLLELLHQLRPDGLPEDDYEKFADDISRRLEQITFTAEFAANTSQ